MTEKQQDLLFKIGLAAGAYLLVIRPALQKIGILQTAGERQQERAIEQAQTGNPQTNPFSPSYYRGRRCTILTAAAADALAERIYKAMGWTDDEDEIFAVFRSLSTKCQVSFLADRFQQRYQRDLFTYLQQGDTNFWWGGLSEGDLGKIVSLVNQLPNG